LNHKSSFERQKVEEFIRLAIAMIIYFSPIYFIGLALDDDHSLFKTIMAIAASWSVIGIFLSYYFASKLQELFSCKPAFDEV
jgi:undecaprenyl pyrophosphate phosphatase UppP